MLGPSFRGQHPSRGVREPITLPSQSGSRERTAGGGRGWGWEGRPLNQPEVSVSPSTHSFQQISTPKTCVTFWSSTATWKPSVQTNKPVGDVFCSNRDRWAFRACRRSVSLQACASALPTLPPSYLVGVKHMVCQTLGMGKPVSLLMIPVCWAAQACSHGTLMTVRDSTALYPPSTERRTEACLV